MTDRVVKLAAFAVCALVVSTARCGTASETRADGSPLVKLASASFPDLTKAERAMLVYADVANLGRGQFAVCGASADPADQSNDPKDAANWTHDRDVRASLIRWLEVDRSASNLVDPKGVRILGARVTGALDLSQVRVPFPMALVRCLIPEPINLVNAEIPEIDLGGSYTAEISALDLNVRGVLLFGAAEPGHIGAFHASGLVNLIAAKAASFYFGGGHFHFSEKPSHSWGQDPAVKMALILNSAQSKGDVVLCCGFESQGAVILPGLTTGTGGDLNCSGGRFINRNNIALFVDANIGGWVFLAPVAPLGLGSGGFYADGSVSFSGTHVGEGFVLQNARFDGSVNFSETHVGDGFVVRNARFDGSVNFSGTHVGENFVVQDARFAGTSTDQDSLDARSLSVANALVWKNVTMESGARGRANCSGKASAAVGCGNGSETEVNEC